MPTGFLSPRLLATPENHSALAAIQDIAHGLTANALELLPNPLFLHGPPGTGKTFLVGSLASELRDVGIDVCQASGNDFASDDRFGGVMEADLLIIDDLHHLPMRFVEMLIKLIDARLQHGSPMIFTAPQGPARLTHRGATYPRRMINRLAGGLVVAMQPMQTNSRRRLLETLAADSQLQAAPEILTWLAENLSGGARQLQGAIRQLATLQRLRKKPLRPQDIEAHIRPQIPTAACSVQRIADHVSGYYRVPARRLLSERRSHDVLLPRQVSMYLARQLTALSLQQIGKYFGGRDHKTVSHACRKVELTMRGDAALTGAVRQLHGELA